MKKSDTTIFEQKVESTNLAQNLTVQHDLHSSIQTDASQFPGCCHCFQLFNSIICKLLVSVMCFKIYFDRKIGHFFAFFFHALRFFRETF